MRRSHSVSLFNFRIAPDPPLHTAAKPTAMNVLRQSVRRLRGTLDLTNRAMSSKCTVDEPVFIVYGASGGIGSELCRKLTHIDGARIVLAGRSEDKLQAVKELCVGDAARMVHVVDVEDPGSVDAVTSATLSQWGRLDGVANCVGSVALKPAHTTSNAEFEKILRINLLSSFNILKSSVKAMMKNPDGRGGSMTFCTSAVATRGIPNHEAIAAAKGGVAALARSAAATYAPKNIRINCVAPGLIETPMTARITGNSAALKASQAMHALGRIGKPGDVAAGLAFLLHPDNSFITGQVFGIDGGLGSLIAQG